MLSLCTTLAFLTGIEIQNEDRDKTCLLKFVGVAVSYYFARPVQNNCS